MLKRIFVTFALVSALLPARADEGMWLPLLLEQNIESMQAKGLKISAADIYSINNGSLKDAICQFNGGCTAELISNEGLLLTNHHCGYGQIQSHSSVENNYIENGFWAMNKGEEKPCPGTTAAFIIRMEDVTKQVLEGVNATTPEKEREEIIARNSAAVEKKAAEGTHYKVFVRGFYNGNVYYLYVTEVFTDVRLVGAPPIGIGNFGGDYDNWVWPRHTGDFSMFRIYAGKDNKPAAYSADNVPYKPRRHLAINMKGVKENDFSWVYGFPGRTTEYLSSYGVNLIQNISDPVKVELRGARLQIMQEEMNKSAAVRIQYGPKYNGVSNSWKKWKGEMLGLRVNDAVGKKEAYEKTFVSIVGSKSAAEATTYMSLLGELKTNYDAITPWQQAIDYMNEGCLSVEMIRYAEGFRTLVEKSKTPGTAPEEITKLAASLRKAADGWFKDYDVTTDKRIAVNVFGMVQKGLDPKLWPQEMSMVEAKMKGNYQAYFDGIYAKTMFADKAKIIKLLDKWTASSWKKVEKDPGYGLATSLYTHYRSKIAPEFNKYNSEIARLNRLYMQAQLDLVKNRKFYPDANSTLRITYGKIEGYNAKDGLTYNWYTTLDGVMEKEDPAVYEYRVPARLKELWMKKDYGMYADKSDNRIHTCFIASNHTTGGNSGSPVLDAQGNLIGTNFDRVWEGTMSDVMFDPNRCRNIAVDVRYTLFIVDKLGGAGYLLNEMTLLK